MDKPHTPLPAGIRIGTAVLAEDLADGTRRQGRQELTWLPRPKPAPVVEDEGEGEPEVP